jgi:hypothetical protein
MTDLSPQANRRKDRAIVALGLLLSALCIGYAIDINNGMYGYDRRPIFWLSIAIAIAVGAFLVKPTPGIESILARRITTALTLGIVVEGAILLHEETNVEPKIAVALGLIMALGAFQSARLRGLRLPLLVIMFVTYFIVSCVYVHTYRDQTIDVLIFQQDGARAILHGHNPYAIRFPNIYPRHTPFYGPGVVDDNNRLTYGFPYPPLSLLMVLPSYIASGNVRYADTAAITVAAILMAFARPGRIGPLVAAIFMLTLRGFYVTTLSWTEPLLTLTFSLTMFCACRWPKAMPYVLGLYFATKQYTVLSLPAIWLLTDGPQPWKQCWGITLRAGAVVAATTLPFFAWNPHEFIRAVVLWQLVQPFRVDALSYLVWIYKHFNGYKPPIWVPFLAVIPAMVLTLRRCSHTPAGFAAAVTLINLAFFAFNKQAFCNYYFFVIATACWAIATMDLPAPAGRKAAGFPVVIPANRY